MATWMHSLQLEPPLETLSPDLGNSAQECDQLDFLLAILLVSVFRLYYSEEKKTTMF